MSSVQKIKDLTPYYRVDKYIIPGTDEAYRVCTNGVVESRWVQSGWRKWIGDENDWHPLSPGIDEKGYLQVCLKINGRKQTKKIHRLVCEAVYGPCPPGMEACHVYDPKPSNNWSWNLKWDTPSNNGLMRRDHGTVPDSTGEKNINAHLTWTIVGQMRADWATGQYTRQQLGEKYGIRSRHIGRILRNEQWVI